MPMFSENTFKQITQRTLLASKLQVFFLGVTRVLEPKFLETKAMNRMNSEIQFTDRYEHN